MQIRYKNSTIYYQITGQGTPIVLLHGFLENSTMWDALIPELSKKRQVITIDLLGHGKTECLSYIHHMETMAATVALILDHEKIAPAVVVGHSMGGYVALALAEIHPELIAKLILINSTAAADSPERQANRDRGILIVKKNPKAYTSMAISNLFAVDNRERYADQIAMIKNEAAKTPLQGIIAVQEGMKIRKDRTEVLQNFGGKKLLISGQQDPILPHHQSVAEAKATNTELCSLDCGHMAHIEGFEAVLHLIINC